MSTEHESHFWPDEVTALVAAVEALRARVAAVSPVLADAMTRFGVRVSHDTNEATVLIALVRHGGRGQPLLAVSTAPGPDFARPGVPVGVPLYSTPEGNVAN